MDVEDAADAGHDLDRAESALPLLEDARRQTGGVRSRPSGNAVLDPDARSLGHPLNSLTPLRRAPR
jgi:hypothetical protein